MRYLALTILLITFFFVENAVAQDYSKMPISVQQKMDENKVNNIDVYTGIEAHFMVEVANLSHESFSTLNSAFQNDPRIKSASIENGGTTLSITSEGNYSIKDVKAHVKTTSASIENYTVNYEISQ